MKLSKWKYYVFWILLCEAVGAAAALLTMDSMKQFMEYVQKPPFTPPAIIFPIVWTILYALMGIGAASINFAKENPGSSTALNLFILQLTVNFLWSLIFFNVRRYGFALFWLILLWAMILWMILQFRKIDVPAGLLQIPYLLWVTLAGIINYGVWQLN